MNNFHECLNFETQCRIRVIDLLKIWRVAYLMENVSLNIYWYSYDKYDQLCICFSFKDLGRDEVESCKLHFSQKRGSKTGRSHFTNKPASSDPSYR